MHTHDGTVEIRFVNISLETCSKRNLSLATLLFLGMHLRNETTAQAMSQGQTHLINSAMNTEKKVKQVIISKSGQQLTKIALGGKQFI